MPPQPKCLCGTCKRCKQRLYTREVYYPRNAERVRAQSNASRLRRLDAAREYDRERALARSKAIDREKLKARFRVQQAIRRGKIERLPCETCGDMPAEAHHDDYSKPFQVRWLCRLHHMELHRRVA